MFYFTAFVPTSFTGGLRKRPAEIECSIVTLALGPLKSLLSAHAIYTVRVQRRYNGHNSV